MKGPTPQKFATPPAPTPPKIPTQIEDGGKGQDCGGSGERRGFELCAHAVRSCTIGGMLRDIRDTLGYPINHRVRSGHCKGDNDCEEQEGFLRRAVGSGSRHDRKLRLECDIRSLAGFRGAGHAGLLHRGHLAVGSSAGCVCNKLDQVGLCSPRAARHEPGSGRKGHGSRCGRTPFIIPSSQARCPVPLLCRAGDDAQSIMLTSSFLASTSEVHAGNAAASVPAKPTVGYACAPDAPLRMACAQGIVLLADAAVFVVWRTRPGSMSEGMQELLIESAAGSTTTGTLSLEGARPRPPKKKWQPPDGVAMIQAPPHCYEH
jgi:hypothetical protein